MRNRPLFYGLCGPFKAYYASRVPIEIGRTLCMCAKRMWRSQTYASLFPATERASEGGIASDQERNAVQRRVEEGKGGKKGGRPGCVENRDGYDDGGGGLKENGVAAPKPNPIPCNCAEDGDDGGNVAN